MRLESRVLVWWWYTNHGLENSLVMMFTDGQVSFEIDVFCLRVMLCVLRWQHTKYSF